MSEHEITPNEVLELIEKKQPVSIIDVREDEEVEAGKIPEAQHIRMSEVPERIDELDKNEQYIVVCRSGRRSGYVSEYLREQGFDAKNMAGGMLEWEGEVRA